VHTVIVHTVIVHTVIVHTVIVHTVIIVQRVECATEWDTVRNDDKNARSDSFTNS